MVKNAGDVGPIPGLGRSPRERNGNPLQYSCLGNPMDRGAWLSSLWGHKESRSTQRLYTTTTLKGLESGGAVPANCAAAHK